MPALSSLTTDNLSYSYDQQQHLSGARFYLNVLPDPRDSAIQLVTYDAGAQLGIETHSLFIEDQEILRFEVPVGGQFLTSLFNTDSIFSRNFYASRVGATELIRISAIRPTALSVEIRDQQGTVLSNIVTADVGDNESFEATRYVLLTNIYTNRNPNGINVLDWGQTGSTDIQIPFEPNVYNERLIASLRQGFSTNLDGYYTDIHRIVDPFVPELDPDFATLYNTPYVYESSCFHIEVGQYDAGSDDPNIEPQAPALEPDIAPTIVCRKGGDFLDRHVDRESYASQTYRPNTAGFGFTKPASLRWNDLFYEDLDYSSTRVIPSQQTLELISIPMNHFVFREEDVNYRRYLNPVVFTTQQDGTTETVYPNAVDGTLWPRRMGGVATFNVSAPLISQLIVSQTSQTAADVDSNPLSSYRVRFSYTNDGQGNNEASVDELGTIYNYELPQPEKCNLQDDDNSAHLVWRNALGGLESYYFELDTPFEYTADRERFNRYDTLPENEQLRNSTYITDRAQKAKILKTRKLNDPDYNSIRGLASSPVVWFVTGLPGNYEVIPCRVSQEQIAYDPNSDEGIELQIIFDK